MLGFHRSALCRGGWFEFLMIFILLDVGGLVEMKPGPLDMHSRQPASKHTWLLKNSRQQNQVTTKVSGCFIESRRVNWRNLKVAEIRACVKSESV